MRSVKEGSNYNVGPYDRIGPELKFRPACRSLQLTTTTKIFVILVCVFSFVFTPLAISYAAQKENWRQLANDYREELNIAYANERSVMAIADSEATRYATLLKQQQTQHLDLQEKMADMQQELTQLTRDRDQLARSRNDWETSARLLTAEMAVKTKHNQELIDTKENALTRERDLRNRNLQLADGIKETNAKIIVLNQQLRQKVEELAFYREENEKLRGLTGVGTTSPLASTPTPMATAAGPAATAGPIQGTVTRIEGSLATVDVGSSAGLRQGMRMVVLRDNSYICDLEITDAVTPTEAVGVVLLERDKRIQIGDKIEDAASFAQR